ncbi:MAG TPA: MBL fold metallo-hydrolase [Candidatus Polarisedimenticolaceae bacterium]
MHALVLAAVATLAAQDPAPLEIVPLADGVYAAVRPHEPGLMFDANNLLVVNDEDVVVVDSNVSAASTREVIAALRKITTKPVRYVVHTHWHDDHNVGDAAWREAYPGVELVGHPATLEDAPTEGKTNRDGLLAYAPDGIKMLRDALANGTSLAGGAITDEERRSITRDLFLVERYVAEVPTARFLLPTVTVDSKLVLHRGARTIEILAVPGHTRADLAVHLPKEGILATGDLLVAPVPLVGAKSRVKEWSRSLETLAALGPRTILPGHGPIQRDTSYLKLNAELYASIWRQVEAAVARGETLEPVRKGVDLASFKKSIAGDSKLRAVLFDQYVAGPAVAAAYAQAGGK